MKKEACVEFAKVLLLRQGYRVYTPVVALGFDLLAERDGAFVRVLVLSVNDEKPIVSLKTSSSGKAALRDFDVLLCTHLPTLTTWMLPSEDVPDKESLYFSERYNCYQIPFMQLTDISKLQAPMLFDKARKQQKAVKDELKEMEKKLKGESVVKDKGYDGLEGLLGN